MLNDESLSHMFVSRSKPAADDAGAEVVLANNAQGTVGDEAEALATTTPANEAAAEEAAIPPEAVAAPDLTMTPPATVEEGETVARNGEYHCRGTVAGA